MKISKPICLYLSLILLSSVPLSAMQTSLPTERTFVRNIGGGFKKFNPFNSRLAIKVASTFINVKNFLCKKTDPIKKTFKSIGKRSFGRIKLGQQFNSIKKTFTKNTRSKTSKAFLATGFASLIAAITYAFWPKKDDENSIGAELEELNKKIELEKAKIEKDKNLKIKSNETLNKIKTSCKDLVDELNKKNSTVIPEITTEKLEKLTPLESANVVLEVTKQVHNLSAKNTGSTYLTKLQQKKLALEEKLIKLKEEKEAKLQREKEEKEKAEAEEVQIDIELEGESLQPSESTVFKKKVEKTLFDLKAVVVQNRVDLDNLHQQVLPKKNIPTIPAVYEHIRQTNSETISQKLSPEEYLKLSSQKMITHTNK